MAKHLLLLLVIMLAFPCLVSAEIDRDLRLKLGSAPGTDRIEIENSVWPSTIGHGPENHRGTNVQVEVVFSPHTRGSFAGFILGVGLFYRQHPGEIQNLSIPIKVDYSAIGMSMAPGLRFRINDAWNVDWKVEWGVGRAKKVALDSPGVNWNATRKGEYISLGPIVGCYYLFENSTSRVGLEFGYQKFWGDFEIRSNSGSWSEGTLSGVNRTVNIVYGIQF